MLPHLIAQQSLEKAVEQLLDRSDLNYQIIDHILSHIGSGHEEKTKIVTAILSAREGAPAPYSIQWDWALEVLRDNQHPRMGQCIAFLTANKKRISVFKAIGLEITRASIRRLPEEIVEELVKFGLVDKRMDPENRIRIMLSPMGRSVYRTLKELE